MFSALGLQAIRAVWEDRLLKIHPEDLGCTPGVKFISAAIGRAHTILVASNGACFSAGLNSSGQVSREAVFFSGKDGTYRSVAVSSVVSPFALKFRRLRRSWERGSMRVTGRSTPAAV